jgi:uncharacterized protein YukE
LYYPRGRIPHQSHLYNHPKICHHKPNAHKHRPSTTPQTHQKTMSQAIMDPEEVRRFAKELKRFNDDIQGRAASLHARFIALSGTWQDQEHEKFAEEFITTMKGLKKFVELSEKHTPFLLRKAQRIEEYLDQR